MTHDLLWVVSDRDGDDLFCTAHEQLAKDQHQNLIEQFSDQGPFKVVKYVPYAAHAAAIDEVERLKDDIRQMVEKAADQHLAGYRELGAKCAALEERAEKAERRAERLKGHAEAMAKYLTIDGQSCRPEDECSVCAILSAYRADKEK